MNIIGTFRRSAEGFEGEIITLSVQATNVRIIPASGQIAPNAPSHRVYVGRAMIGAGWPSREADTGLLTLKLDDPSFSAPIRAALLEDEDGASFTLVWSRADRVDLES